MLRDSSRLASRHPPHQEPARRGPRPGQRALQRPPGVLRQAPAPRHPREGPFHHPAAVRDRESPGSIGLPHDPDDRSQAVLRQRGPGLRTRVAAVRQRLRHLRRLPGIARMTAGAPSRSRTSAPCTRSAVGNPPTSTVRCRLRPLAFLSASCQRAASRERVGETAAPPCPGPGTPGSSTPPMETPGSGSSRPSDAACGP